MLGGAVELICRAVTAYFATKSGRFVNICYANASSWLVTGIFLLFCYFYVIKKIEKKLGN